MLIAVNFFAPFLKITGCSRAVFTPEEGARVRDLRSPVFPKYTSLRDVKQTLTSLNGDFAEDGDILREGDVVAFFPPVRGG